MITFIIQTRVFYWKHTNRKIHTNLHPTYCPYPFKEVKFTEAEIKSFTEENRNANNAKLKKKLYVTLNYSDKKFLQSKLKERLSIQDIPAPS